MKHPARFAAGILALIVIASLLAGCAPGNERFLEAPAGFFWGLWHGCISLITLIVGIWNDSVHMYEVQNSGAWYDFGFLLGVACMCGGGGRGGSRGWRRRTHGNREQRRRNQAEWEEVGRKVEAKVKRELRAWAEAEPDESWDEAEKKIEERVRKVLENWADDE